MNLFTPVFQFVQNVTDFFVSIWSDKTDATYEVVGPSTINGYMGLSIAFDETGYYMVTGEYQSNKFHVYRYNGNGYELEATIVGDTDGSSEFGHCLDISKDGNIIVVGQRELNDVHIFQKNPNDTWNDQLSTNVNDITNNSQYATQAEPAGSTSEFGSSVKISGDGSTIIVGAPYWSDGRGAIYVYYQANSNWHQRVGTAEDAVMYLADRTTQDLLGASVAINEDGTVIFAGAPQWDDPTGTPAQQGCIAVFEKGNGWVNESNEDAILVTSDTSPGNRYLGCTVECDAAGETVVGGTRFNHEIEVFEKGNGWSSGITSDNNVAKLIPDSVNNIQFGEQAIISKDGNYIVGHEMSLSSSLKNQAFVFEKGDGWADFDNNLVATLSDTALSASSNQLSYSGYGSTSFGLQANKGSAISWDNKTIAFHEYAYDSDISNVGKIWVWKSDV